MIKIGVQLPYGTIFTENTQRGTSGYQYNARAPVGWLIYYTSSKRRAGGWANFNSGTNVKGVFYLVRHYGD